MSLLYKLILILLPVFLTRLLSYGQDSSKMTLEDSIKMRYVHYPVKYPQKAKENGISGTVVITFDVDSTCSIINRNVQNGLGYGCDEAVLSVLDRIEKDIKQGNKSNCKPFSTSMSVQFIQK